MKVKNNNDKEAIRENIEKLKNLYQEQIKLLDYDIERNQLKLFGSIRVTEGLLLNLGILCITVVGKAT